MYEFVDTNNSGEQQSNKLSEAMRINGEYIEDLIDGYKTVYVKGRESLERTLSTYERAIRDGDVITKSRYPARTLTVGFQITAETAEDYMDKFTELNRILMVEDAEIIFDDESEVYYIGTPINNCQPDPGRRSVIAEFDIYCADPFKYSTTMFEAVGVWDGESDENTRTFDIDYQGNVPARPILEAEMGTAFKHKDIVERWYEFYISTDPDELEDGEWSEEYGYEGDDAPIGYVFKREHRVLDTEVDEYYPSEDGVRVELYSDEEEESTADGNENERIKGDVGYIAFYDDQKHIIQLGNPYQMDEVEYPESLNIVNTYFTGIGSWDSNTISQWQATGNVLPGHTRKGSYGLAYDHYEEKDKTETKATVWSGKHKTGGKTVKKKGKKVKYNEVTYSNLVVTAKNRKSTEVTLDVSLNVYANSSAEKKLGLEGVLTVNGSEYRFRIKGTSSGWKKGSHNVKKTITVKGLTSTTNKLTFKFQVSQSGSTGASMSKINGNAMSIQTEPQVPQTGYYLAPTAFESGAGWHGPCIRRNIIDETGSVGASKFTFEWNTKMCMGNDTNNAKAQLGAQVVLLTDLSDDVVAGVKIEKSAVANKGTVEIIVNNKVVKTFNNFPLEYINEALGTSGTIKGDKKKKTKDKKITASNLCKIVSAEGKLSFNIGGYVFEMTEGHNDVTAISIGIFQNGNNPVLRFNGIRNVKFVKDICENIVDIPNAFTSGDRVIVDCSSAEINMNGARRQDLGALGNDWQDFVLEKGENNVQGAFSEWAKVAPELKVRWREVYI